MSSRGCGQVEHFNIFILEKEIQGAMHHRCSHRCAQCSRDRQHVRWHSERKDLAPCDFGRTLTLYPQFFDFHTAKLEKTLVLPCSALSMTLQRDSGLLAVVCEDRIVRLVDIETQKVVRELRGHRGRILDLVNVACFNDIWKARLIQATSADFLPRFEMACHRVTRLHHPYFRHPDRPAHRRLPHTECRD